jgi:hypothetical protein
MRQRITFQRDATYELLGDAAKGLLAISGLAEVVAEGADDTLTEERGNVGGRKTLDS